MLTCQAGTAITETHEHLCHTKSIKVLCHRQGGLHAIRIHKIVYIPSNYTVKSWFLLTVHTVSYRTTFKSMLI
jgi:hypothetical protein